MHSTLHLLRSTDFQGRSARLPLIATPMSLRSRGYGIATGDQAIFVRPELFQRLGGLADQPLTEDIELSRRLRAIGRPACLRPPAITSGRRRDTQGAWRLCRRYWRGVAPELLAGEYR